MTNRRVLLVNLLAAWAVMALACGFLDYAYEVSGGYWVIRSSRDQVIIAPALGKGAWASSDATAIPSKVVEIAWDDRFILARQQHLDRAGNPIRGTFSYWVLDVVKRRRFGPLSES